MKAESQQPDAAMMDRIQAELTGGLVAVNASSTDAEAKEAGDAAYVRVRQVCRDDAAAKQRAQSAAQDAQLVTAGSQTAGLLKAAGDEDEDVLDFDADIETEPVDTAAQAEARLKTQALQMLAFVQQTFLANIADFVRNRATQLSISLEMPVVNKSQVMRRALSSSHDQVVQQVAAMLDGASHSFGQAQEAIGASQSQGHLEFVVVQYGIMAEGAISSMTVNAALSDLDESCKVSLSESIENMQDCKNIEALKNAIEYEDPQELEEVD